MFDGNHGNQVVLFMLSGNHGNQVVYFINLVKLSYTELNDFEVSSCKISSVKLG
jgi:hypothetical protein